MPNSKPYILVSSCILGNRTRYDGASKKNSNVNKLYEYFTIIPICPEVDGGLLIPRDPCEIVGDKIISVNGKDCTKEYKSGAEKSLNLALKYKVKYAVLKESSPSCGVHNIHDGKFIGEKIPGQGITTELLSKNHIRVFSDEEIDILISLLKTN